MGLCPKPRRFAGETPARFLARVASLRANQGSAPSRVAACWAGAVPI